MSATNESPEIGDRPTEPALHILRRGLAVTPTLRRGLAFTVAAAVLGAVGKLTVPLLIRVATDRGLRPGSDPDLGFVLTACGAAAVLIMGIFLLQRWAFVRLVVLTERSLLELRMSLFEHLHRLSIAHHETSRRGVLVARVTSDVEQLGKFFEWAGMSWIINTTLLTGTLAVMLAVSWQLTVVVLLGYVALIPILRAIQVRQLRAYSTLRTRVGETLGEFSEAIGGALTIRAFGLEDRAGRRLNDAIDRQYRARMKAVRFFSVLFTLGDLFGAVALSSVVLAAAWWGDAWDLQLGQVLAFVFLVTLVAGPVGELSEILDQTQIALAGWQKILGVLDTPVGIVEPDRGRSLPDGPLDVELRNVSFSYRPGTTVLGDVTLTIPAGTRVAVVGATGSGKSTLAKLLVRLVEPDEGEIRVGGLPLPCVDPGARRGAIRMVPQDGFLFDTTLADNIAYGRPGADRTAVEVAVDDLGLRWWVDRLPAGLDTQAGERGDSLSVGERQLVALVRAQVADPGLLILDEATSSVDPETEMALADALERLAQGRTTVSIAHRLSTAERADLVLVIDRGRLVGVGPHHELLGSNEVYQALHRSWIGATRSDRV